MNTPKRAPADAARVPPTANERFKRRYRRYFWTGMATAALAHVLIAILYPAAVRIHPLTSSRPLRLVELPEGASPAPPPPPLPRPLLIGPPPPREAIPAPAPPADPPDPVETELLDRPAWMPYDVAPVLRNPERAREALSAAYPEARRRAGLGATVHLWFLIDERGRVRQTLVRDSSGDPAVDEAALSAAEVMEFTPGIAGGRPIPLWIVLPVHFAVEPLEA